MNEQNTRSEALDLDELVWLEKRAHPAPWFGEDITEDGLTVIDDGLTADDHLFPIQCEDHEAALIVALRNAAPALIARARRADELAAEVERLKSAWQERENEALTLRAANADFARSFGELQDELAAGRKDTARLDWLGGGRNGRIPGRVGNRWTVRDVFGWLLGEGPDLRAAIDAVRAQQSEVKP